MALETGSRPLVRGLSARLIALAALVASVWIVETMVASGPFVAYYGRHIGNLVSIAWFVLSFSIAVVLVGTAADPRPKDRRDANRAVSAVPARVAAVAAIGITAFAFVTGRATYNPVLGEEGRSDDPLSILWRPIAIGAGAALLASRRKLAAIDWVLLLSLGVVGIVGGRTTPGLLLIMVVVRYVFMPSSSSASPRRVPPWTVLAFVAAAVAVALGFSAFAALRSAADGGIGFTESNLAFYGYSGWPTWMQSLVATLGVIGESSHVTHAVVPARIEFQGWGLLFEDILSLLPGQQRPVTAATIDTYGALGSVVFVSRPGGTASTFYLIGGDLAVALGGAAYGALMLWLVRRVYAGARIVSPSAFLVIASTFVLGAYGTGTPTTISLLAVVFASLIASVEQFGRGRRRVSRISRGVKDPAERSQHRRAGLGV